MSNENISGEQSDVDLFISGSYFVGIKGDEPVRFFIGMTAEEVLNTIDTDEKLDIDYITAFDESGMRLTTIAHADAVSYYIKTGDQNWTANF